MKNTFQDDLEKIVAVFSKKLKEPAESPCQGVSKFQLHVRAKPKQRANR